MKYYLASDHAGFSLKESIKQWLLLQEVSVQDLGCHDESRVDYPHYAQKMASILIEESENRGILVCGSGIGMSIAINRFKGIRAALCHDAYTAELSRRHNDANVLCMGARVVGVGVAESILKAFLQTPFEGGRHTCRIEQIDHI